MAQQQLTNRIREFRKARGLNLQTLAAQIGGSIANLSELERGKRQLTQSWMLKIANALSIEPVELLPFDQHSTGLTPDEAALIRAYRHSSPANKSAILRVAEALNN